jgi:signal transduction histidine kinase
MKQKKLIEVRRAREAPLVARRQGRVLLVTRDAALAESFFEALQADGLRVAVPIAAGLMQARSWLRRAALDVPRPAPLVMVLDELGLDAAALEPALAEFSGVAPLILLMECRRAERPCGGDAAAGDRSPAMLGDSSLVQLLAAGALDILPRHEAGAPLAAGLVARHMRPREREIRLALDAPAPASEFGELLRHEVNNPLTGILGNAELLLARREQLPSFAVARLETIAELAIRLRETVRRFSNTLSAPPEPLARTHSGPLR